MKENQASVPSGSLTDAAVGSFPSALCSWWPVPALCQLSIRLWAQVARSNQGLEKSCVVIRQYVLPDNRAGVCCDCAC